MRHAPIAMIAGLDLSLRGTGIALVPRDWDGDWAKVMTACVGLALPADASAGERLRRLRHLADSTTELLSRHRVSAVYVEGYSYGKQFQAHQLGELGGVVKLSVLEVLGVEPVSVAPLSARKTLLGGDFKVKGSKAAAAKALKVAGARFITGDEGDAFVVANHGLALLGARAVCLGSPPVVKARRVRAK